MADPAGILDAIDSALRDDSVSGDAMRWTPATLPVLSPRQMAVARQLCASTGMDGYAAAVAIADASELGAASPWWLEVREAGGRAFPFPGGISGPWQIPPGTSVLGDALDVRVMVDVSRFAAALQEVYEAFARAMMPGLLSLGKSMTGLAHDLDYADRPRWHRRHCRTCNPAAFCDPLPGGTEYHRRQRARLGRARA